MFHAQVYYVTLTRRRDRHYKLYILLDNSERTTRRFSRRTLMALTSGRQVLRRAMLLLPT